MLALLWACSCLIAWAAPEDPGPLAVERYEADGVVLLGDPVPLVVYRPERPEAGPAVVVVHGRGGTASEHELLAETLASYGVVAAVPEVPGQVRPSRVRKDAELVSALLDWLVAESGSDGSPLAGQVDADALGAVGFSRGGVPVFLAAERDWRIRTVVGGDPVDKNWLVARHIDGIGASSLHLVSDHDGPCNGFGWRERTYEGAPAAKAMFLLPGTDHCDTNDAPGACDEVCSGLPETENGRDLYRRFAVAWVVCHLAGDASMADWLDGTAFAEAEAAGDVVVLDRSPDDALQCVAPGPAPQAPARGCAMATSRASIPGVLGLLGLAATRRSRRRGVPTK